MLALVILLMLLQVADVLTTITALESGAGREANGFLALVMNRFGNTGLIMVKVALVVGILYLYKHHYLYMPVLILLNIIYAVVVWHNYRFVKR